jgi:hypothetical protein
MPASQWLTIAVEARKDVKLTVSRTGDLYGCQLTLFVKFQGPGAAEMIPDAEGKTNTDFMHSPDVRTIPASKLRSAGSVFVDVIVTVDQPAKLSGAIDFTAVLEMDGQPASQTDSKVTLQPGDEADATRMGWEIDKS